MKSYYIIPGLKEVDRELKVNLVINAVCDEYEIDPSDLQLKTNLRKVVEPRQVCHYLLRRYSTYTLREIGEFIGNKPHDLVLHGVKKIRDLIEFDADLRERVQKISQNIGTLQMAGDLYTGKTVFDFKFMNIIEQNAYLRRI